LTQLPLRTGGTNLASQAVFTVGHGSTVVRKGLRLPSPRHPKGSSPLADDAPNEAQGKEKNGVRKSVGRVSILEHVCLGGRQGPTLPIIFLVGFTRIWSDLVAFGLVPPVLKDGPGLAGRRMAASFFIWSY
jgi:hypothetical protein